jgi:hypothetical protein
MFILRWSASLLTVISLSGGLAQLAAQQPPPTGLTLATDPGMAVLPPRGLDRIEAELELARSELHTAEAEKAAAGERRSRRQGEAEVKKHEISTLEARTKLAEKMKDESGKASVTAEKKVGEREKVLLEREADLHKTEVEVADKRRALAEASQEALGTELEVARRRQERSRVTVAGPEASQLDQVIRELEGKALEAQRHRAQARADLADKEKQLVDRRIEIFQAQAAR